MENKNRFKVILDGVECEAEEVGRIEEENMGVQFIYYYIVDENDKDDDEKLLYASIIDDGQIIPITNEPVKKLAFKAFSEVYGRIK